MIKISNIGNNQTEIQTEDAYILVSYKTPVAAHYKRQSYQVDVNYSRTTSKHINQWLQHFDGPQQYRSPEWFVRLLDGDEVE